MLTLLCSGFVYFLPTVCAFYRKHNARAAIFVLNLLLGWTLIAWVIALVWSLNANVEHAQQVVIYNPPPGPRG
ncbi:MAG TPA: superinfection immunity protein [Candidatus Koribacter sp.]|jgi:uncharacterized membrane protein